MMQIRKKTGMCEDHKAGRDKPIEDAAYAAERREKLSRFLSEINSGRKPSGESMDWWLQQYQEKKHEEMYTAGV
jgi:hypothetical protein